MATWLSAALRRIGNALSPSPCTDQSSVHTRNGGAVAPARSRALRTRRVVG